MRNRKIFVFVLFLWFLSVSDLYAVNGDMGGGAGVAKYPYLIEDFEDFQEFCNDPCYWDDHVRLECDLDLDPNLEGREVYSRAPIAGDTNDVDTYHRFDGIAYTGNFDGNGYVISNLTVDGGYYCGLFGNINKRASIHNLHLENISMSGDFYIGGLVGYNDFGSVMSCYSTGTITGNHYIGGLVGYSNFGSVMSCYSTGTVTGDHYIGGLLGDNYFSVVANCYSTGAICGNSGIGGLVGANYGFIMNCYSTGIVIGNDYVGGLVGSSAGSTTSSFWNIETSGINTSAGGTGKTTLEMQDTNTFINAGWDFVGESNDGTNEIWQIPISGGYPMLSIFNGYIPIVLSGDGTPSSPYLISNAAELGSVYYYRNNSSFRLESDIDVNNIQWSTSVVPSFGGSFDGNGHIVYNLNIKGDDYIGMFGMTNASAEIRYLVLENASITGNNYVGGIVGRNYHGNIIGSCLTGSITGNKFVGGIVGWNYGSVMSNYFTGIITSTSYAGGIVGINYGIVASSYSTGTVTGEDRLGGLVGSNAGSIMNTYSIGPVTGTGYSVGGLTGWNGGSVTSSFWDIEISGTNISAGGTGKTTLSMQDINTFINAGWDFVGDSDDGTNEIWQMPISGGYPVLSIFNGYIPIVLSGDGTSSSPYLISNSAELGAIYHYSNNSCFRLESDIDVNNIQWSKSPVLWFSGIFDGNSHVLYNLNIKGGGYLGLFSMTTRFAEIKNLGVENVSIYSTGSCVGGIIGQNYYGSVKNCYSKGSVTGKYDVGGIIGGNDHGYITVSYSTSLIAGSKSVGGLVGDNYYSTIINSYSTGDVTGKYDSIGGFVGHSYYGLITNCYSKGLVTGGDDHIGGFMGYNSVGKVISCYSTGFVNCGDSYGGGLIGSNSGNVVSSYSANLINGDEYIGGLIGSNSGDVANSYSKSSINGNKYIGGLIGYNSGSIESCYSTGLVDSDDEYVGGFVGYNRDISQTNVDDANVPIEGCFWDIETSCMTNGLGNQDFDPNGIKGKTTIEMQTMSTFINAGWDFVDVWGIGQGQTYPYLRQYSAADVSADGVVNFDDFAMLADRWLE